MTLRLSLLIDANAKAAKSELDATAASAGKLTAGVDQLGKQSQQTRTQMGGLQDQTQRTTQATNLSAGAVGNLTAQFNDIGVMLMAGQNPLQLAIQQGTQITQVIGPMGARGALQALGSAFMGLLTPINLITIGSIAAGAAMLQWFTGAGTKAKSLEDAMQSLSEHVDAYGKANRLANSSAAELTAEFGIQTAVIRGLLEQLAEVEKRSTERATKGMAQSIANELQINIPRFDIGDQVKLADFFDLSIWSREARGEINSVLTALTSLDQAKTLDEQIVAGQGLSAAFKRAAEASGEIGRAEDEVLERILQTTAEAMRFKRQMGARDLALEHKGAAETAQAGAETARDGAQAALADAQAVVYGTDPVFANVRVTGLASGPGTVPIGAEILWPARLAFPSGYNDTGQRLLTGTSERSILVFGENDETLRFMLFGPDGPGVQLDPSDLSTLYQDAAGTLPVTAAGQPVGRILDKSGRGNHATQPVASARPTLARHPAGGVRNLLIGTEALPPVRAGISWVDAGDGSFAMTEDTSTGEHRWNQVVSLSLASHTASIELKRGVGARNARLFVYQSSTPFTPLGVAAIDLSTGTVTSGAATVTATSDGWWRVVFTGIAPAASVTWRLDMLHTAAPNYTGDGASSIRYRKPQLELGSEATPYQKVVSPYDVTEAGAPDLWHLYTDPVDDALAVTVPTGGWTNATIALALATGVTILTGQTIPEGAWTLPLPRPSNCYGAVVVNRALTAAETARLTAYLNAKREV